MTAPSPYRVCFVCTGNICRSPMAEAVFRARSEDAGLDGHVEVDSGGTGPWHEGDPADHRAVAALSAHGYEQHHVARHFQPEWFDRLDLVIALDYDHFEELRSIAPTPDDAEKVQLLRGYDPAADPDGPGGLDVPDPYFGGAEDFEECLEMIEEACEGLLDEVRQAVRDAAEALDVVEEIA
jgi:protein-tyrosine phosphatase